MDDAERKATLDRLGQLFVDARDATFDEMLALMTEDSGGSIASFVRSRYRQGGLSKEELCDVVGYYVDHLMIELAYKIQDAEIAHGLTLQVETASQPPIAIDQLSDGLAGEFMTEDGWLERKSRHGRNRFAACEP